MLKVLLLCLDNHIILLREQVSHYALNFEEVDRAYWFRVVRACVRESVRPCVHPSVRQELCMLGF